MSLDEFDHLIGPQILVGIASGESEASGAVSGHQISLPFTKEAKTSTMTTEVAPASPLLDHFDNSGQQIASEAAAVAISQLSASSSSSQQAIITQIPVPFNPQQVQLQQRHQIGMNSDNSETNENLDGGNNPKSHLQKQQTLGGHHNDKAQGGELGNNCDFHLESFFHNHQNQHNQNFSNQQIEKRPSSSGTRETITAFDLANEPKSMHSIPQVSGLINDGNQSKQQQYRASSTMNLFGNFLLDDKQPLNNHPFPQSPTVSYIQNQQQQHQQLQHAISSLSIQTADFGLGRQCNMQDIDSSLPVIDQTQNMCSAGSVTGFAPFGPRNLSSSYLGQYHNEFAGHLPSRESSLTTTIGDLARRFEQTANLKNNNNNNNFYYYKSSDDIDKNPYFFMVDKQNNQLSENTVASHLVDTFNPNRNATQPSGLDFVPSQSYKLDVMPGLSFGGQKSHQNFHAPNHQFRNYHNNCQQLTDKSASDAIGRVFGTMSLADDVTEAMIQGSQGMQTGDLVQQGQANSVPGSSLSLIGPSVSMFEQVERGTKTNKCNDVNGSVRSAPSLKADGSKLALGDARKHLISGMKRKNKLPILNKMSTRGEEIGCTSGQQQGTNLISQQNGGPLISATSTGSVGVKQALPSEEQTHETRAINNNPHSHQIYVDMHGSVNSDGSERYSRKVFAGGLPPDIDEDEINATFRRFGSLSVDWPHKAESKSYFPPKGYAFLLFHEELSVQALVDACFQEDDKLYLYVSSPSTTDKLVQIRPWRLIDADYVMDVTLALDPRKTVFVGGVPRPLKAYELATIMNNLYGDVCYAGIDTDPELKYPKGAGRVAFSSHESYLNSISARFVQLHHKEFEKRVEVKPYVLDDQSCDECQGVRCQRKFAPFFCANISCLRYYCENCWPIVHSIPGKEYHKPLVKEGADRQARSTSTMRWS